MRGNRSALRGESGRVAARVRELLAEHDATPVPWAGGPGAETGWPLGADEETGAPVEVLGARAGGPPWWRRFAARVSLRVDPGRRGALAVGAAVLVAAVVTGVWLMSQRPRAMNVSASSPNVAGSSPLTSTSLPGASSPITPSSGHSLGVPATASPSAEVPVVVDVAGRVRRPGLYRLPTGSRVDDAIRAAGGALRGVDLTSLNLAAKVVDGQQIAVGLPGAPVAAPSGGAAGSAGSAGSASGSASGPVDLNTASLEQLETLPGVGPVLGQHILDWRTAHGSFATVDQLRDVTGIGDVKFAALRPLVSV